MRTTTPPAAAPAITAIGLSSSLPPEMAVTGAVVTSRVMPGGVPAVSGAGSEREGADDGAGREEYGGDERQRRDHQG